LEIEDYDTLLNIIENDLPVLEGIAFENMIRELLFIFNRVGWLNNSSGVCRHYRIGVKFCQNSKTDITGVARQKRSASVCVGLWSICYGSWLFK